MVAITGSGGVGNSQVLMYIDGNPHWVTADRAIAFARPSPEDFTVNTINDLTSIQGSDEAVTPATNTPLTLAPINQNFTKKSDDHDGGDDSDDSDDEDKDFTLFKKLPVEMCLNIWKFALPAGRVIQLLEASSKHEPEAITLATSGRGYYFLTVPNGANRPSQLTPLYFVNRQAQIAIDSSYKTKALTFVSGLGLDNFSRHTTGILFDAKVDKLLFAATGARELKHLYANFDVSNMHNFALVVSNRVLKSKKKLPNMFKSLFKAMPALKNLEVVVGPNWHTPYYEDEVKLVEIDEKFANWVRDEHAWDTYGGLHELVNIKDVLDLEKSVKGIWKLFVDSHDEKAHARKNVNFKVSTTAWLLGGGSDVGMYQLRYRKPAQDEDDEEEEVQYWHTNIGYADEKTGEVEIPERTRFPQSYPGVGKDGFLNHNAVFTPDTGNGEGSTDGTGEGNGEGDNNGDTDPTTAHQVASAEESDSDEDSDSDSDSDL